MELGRKIYEKQCAMCHGDEGKGLPPVYPPLANNQSITMASPVNSDPHGAEWRLSARARRRIRGRTACRRSRTSSNDAEVAAVVTYIRVAWGNTGTPVTAAQVNELRKLLPE